MRRLLTEQEEIAIRMVHHDFAGNTYRDAAEAMDISYQMFCKLLRSAEKKAPQLFPVLTGRQKQVYDYITKDGLNHRQIAELMGVEVATVERIAGQIHTKDTSFNKRPKKPVRYAGFMDSKIVEKF